MKKGINGRTAALAIAIAGLVSSSLRAAANSTASAVPDELRCEYRKDPLGISSAVPRLSWLLVPTSSGLRGVKETAYRIVVASSTAGLTKDQGDLWDTGRVLSSDSVNVAYDGKTLLPGARAYWKVQVWDERSLSSRWSSPAMWSAALGTGDWTAQWIGHEERGLYKDEASPFQLLTKAQWIRAGTNTLTTSLEVNDANRVREALAVISVDPGFEFFINNKRIGRGDRASVPAVWQIGPYLKSGRNTLAIVPNASKTPASTIAAFRVTTSDGTVSDLVTDAGWSGATVLSPYGSGPLGQVGFEEAHALPARLLRKEFRTDKPIAQATASVSGLGLFELYLNGRKVGDHVLSPNLTDYDKHVQFVTFDVTEELRSGSNAVGVLLGNGRFWAPRLQYPIASRNFGYPRAIAQIDIEYQDGSKARIATDRTWKISTDGPIRTNNEYDGERYDARREQRGWAEPGFQDESWSAAELVAPPAGELVPQEAEPLRVTETIKPLNVKEVHPGVYLYDLGQNMVGWCRIRVKGAKGDIVTLRHAETLTDGGELYTANLRSALATDQYVLKGDGEEQYEPRFTYHGFRYVEVRGPVESLEGRVVHDSLEQVADFQSSDAMLNQTHHNVFWGVRGNYRSIPTDCPQRDERQGWLGDRSVVCRSESYLFNVAALYSKWERDLADSQSSEGTIPDVAPNFWEIYTEDVTWPSTFVQVPSMLYEQYADRRVIEQNYTAIQKWIAHTRTHLKNGLLVKDTYGDWCVPPENPSLIHSEDPARKTEGALLSTAYFYWMHRQVARFARLLGKEQDGTDYDKAADELRISFNRAYYHPEQGMYGNGTQTANALPLAFGMVEASERKRVFQSLVDNIQTKSNNHIGTGLVGAQWIMRTLTENGGVDVAYKMATQPTYPGWGYMVSRGATTVWELWNGDTADPAMNSGNHVMQIGDLGLWMYEDLAGIRSDPEHPGFQHFIIRPYPPSQLQFVKASHKSPYGLIGSEWRRQNGTLQMIVSVPPNTTATIWVPARDRNSIQAPSEEVVRFVRMDEGAAVFEVSSGQYKFTAPAE